MSSHFATLTAHLFLLVTQCGCWRESAAFVDMPSTPQLDVVFFFFRYDSACGCCAFDPSGWPARIQPMFVSLATRSIPEKPKTTPHSYLSMASRTPRPPPAVCTLYSCCVVVMPLETKKQQHSNLWNGAIFSYMMYTLGPTAIQHLGRRQFLSLYMLGGAFSQRENAFSCWRLPLLIL